jgi:hypothetical protein
MITILQDDREIDNLLCEFILDKIQQLVDENIYKDLINEDLWENHGADLQVKNSLDFLTQPSTAMQTSMSNNNLTNILSIIRNIFNPNIIEQIELALIYDCIEYIELKYIKRENRLANIYYLRDRFVIDSSYDAFRFESVSFLNEFLDYVQAVENSIIDDIKYWEIKVLVEGFLVFGIDIRVNETEYGNINELAKEARESAIKLHKWMIKKPGNNWILGKDEADAGDDPEPEQMAQLKSAGEGYSPLGRRGTVRSGTTPTTAMKKPGSMMEDEMMEVDYDGSQQQTQEYGPNSDDESFGSEVPPHLQIGGPLTQAELEAQGRQLTSYEKEALKKEQQLANPKETFYAGPQQTSLYSFGFNQEPADIKPCPWCNRNIMTSVDRCPYCQNDVKNIKFCQNCRAVNFIQANECRDCGYQLFYQGGKKKKKSRKKKRKKRKKTRRKKRKRRKKTHKKKRKKRKKTRRKK